MPGQRKKLSTKNSKGQTIFTQGISHLVTIVLTLHLLIPALPTASILINSVTLALWTPLSLLLTLSPRWTLFALPTFFTLPTLFPLPTLFTLSSLFILSIFSWTPIVHWAFPFISIFLSIHVGIFLIYLWCGVFFIFQLDQESLRITLAGDKKGEKEDEVDQWHPWRLKLLLALSLQFSFLLSLHFSFITFRA